MLRNTFLVIAGVLLIGNTANAQYRDHRDGEQYRRSRVTLNRVIADLDRLAPRVGYLPDFELRRLDMVRQRLGSLDRKMERGRFDAEDVNQATRGLREFTDRARLRPRDRAVVDDCLIRLREFRDRFERRT